MKLHCVASRRHFRPTAFWFSILDSRSCDLGSPTGSQLVSCVEARRSAAFEAPTGLCSIQGAATSTRSIPRHPAPGTAFKSSSGNGALMHVQTSSVLVSFLVLSFILFLFLGNAFVAFFSFICPSLTSVRLASCLSVVFICLFVFSCCCLFSINI